MVHRLSDQRRSSVRTEVASRGPSPDRRRAHPDRDDLAPGSATGHSPTRSPEPAGSFVDQYTHFGPVPTLAILVLHRAGRTPTMPSGVYRTAPNPDSQTPQRLGENSTGRAGAPRRRPPVARPYRPGTTERACELRRGRMSPGASAANRTSQDFEGEMSQRPILPPRPRPKDLAIILPLP